MQKISRHVDAVVKLVKENGGKINLLQFNLVGCCECFSEDAQSLKIKLSPWGFKRQKRWRKITKSE